MNITIEKEAVLELLAWAFERRYGVAVGSVDVWADLDNDQTIRAEIEMLPPERVKDTPK